MTEEKPKIKEPFGEVQNERLADLVERRRKWASDRTTQIDIDDKWAYSHLVGEQCVCELILEKIEKEPVFTLGELADLMEKIESLRRPDGYLPSEIDTESDDYHVDWKYLFREKSDLVERIRKP